MKYDLTAIYRRAKPNARRRAITFRKITVPATFASNLYTGAYKPIIEAWQAAVDPIMAEYARTLSEMTQDSPEQTAAHISATETSVNAVLLSVRVRLERWALLLESYQRRKWRGAVLSATEIDIGTMIGPSDMRMPVSAAIERNVSLVKSVSEQTRARIGDSVFRGFQQRKPAREVAAEITEAVGMGRRRALNIAADQTVKLGEALNEERRREAGLSTWAWVSSHKLHYRPEHAARDGKRYDDDAKSGEHKPPDDRPGQLPYCGCTSRAVLSLEGEF